MNGKQSHLKKSKFFMYVFLPLNVHRLKSERREIVKINWVWSELLPNLSLKKDK